MKEQEFIIDFDTNPPVPASDYEKMALVAIPGYEAMHTMALSFFRSKLPEKANLLIVGAGGGMELVTFGKSNLQWQMLGVEPSSNMLTIAQKKIEQHGLSERVKLHQGYTHDLPTTPLYDGATCILVMHFLPDDGSKLALLQSIAQRLKSSAYFILVDLFGDTGTETFQQLASVLKLFWEEKGMKPEKMVELLATINKGVHPIPEPRVFELLKSAGFGNILRFYTGIWYGGWVATKN